VDGYIWLRIEKVEGSIRIAMRRRDEMILIGRQSWVDGYFGGLGEDVTRDETVMLQNLVRRRSV
jgi:hypothetical protein